MSEPVPAPLTARLGVLVSAAVVGLYAVRLTGPSDLIDYGQEAATAYVMDAVWNGHWLVQRDLAGVVMSKPPLYTWLAGAVSAVAGTINRFTLSLPAALSTLALSWLVLWAGCRYFGWRAGLLGSVAYVASGIVAKQVALVRTDGLFALTVTGAGLLAFRAWQTGRGWAGFWFVAALATLTKGPLGVLLAALGLLAAGWERRTGRPVPIGGSHRAGLTLFALLTLGWFGTAYLTLGHVLVEKMLVTELYGRAVSKGPGSRMLTGFYLPWAYFLGRFAPWSAVAALGLWRVWRHPASEPEQRRFERFLFCWLLGGLVLFSVAAHQRPDLLFPLIPAAALLVGRELARWLKRLRGSAVVMIASAIAATSLVPVTLYYHGRRAGATEVVQTASAIELARVITAQVGPGFPLVYAGTSPVLQLSLGASSPWVAPERAAAVLQGAEPVFVLLDGPDDLKGFWGTNQPSIHLLAEGPKTRRSHPRLLSNHPRLEWTDPLLTQVGPLQLRLHGVRGVAARGNDLQLRTGSGSPSVRVTNRSEHPQWVRVRFVGGKIETRVERELAPGESWLASAAE